MRHDGDADRAAPLRVPRHAIRDDVRGIWRLLRWLLLPVLVLTMLSYILPRTNTGQTILSNPQIRRRLDWRYDTTPVDLTTTGIPVVDTTYVEPLRVLDATRAHYAEMAEYDWAGWQHGLEEFEKLTQLPRYNRSLWGRAGGYLADQGVYTAIEGAKSDFQVIGNGLEGWNASVSAVRGLCKSFVANANRHYSHHGFAARVEHAEPSTDVGLGDPAKIVELSRASFEGVLKASVKNVQTILNHLHPEERTIGRLLGNVQAMRKGCFGYAWTTPWEAGLGWQVLFNLFGLRQRTWKDAIRPLAEETMTNLTSAQKGQLVDKMAARAEDVESKLKTAYVKLLTDQSDVEKVRAHLKAMIGKLQKDEGVKQAFNRER